MCLQWQDILAVWNADVNSSALSSSEMEGGKWMLSQKNSSPVLSIIHWSLNVPLDLNFSATSGVTDNRKKKMRHLLGLKASNQQNATVCVGNLFLLYLLSLQRRMLFNAKEEIWGVLYWVRDKMKWCGNILTPRSFHQDEESLESKHVGLSMIK